MRRLPLVFLPLALACVLGARGEDKEKVPDPLDLQGAFPAGSSGAFEGRIAVEEKLQRDIQNPRIWVVARVQKREWTFRLAWKVKKSSPQAGVQLEMELQDLRGTWTDTFSPEQKPEPKLQRDLNTAFEPEANPGKGTDPTDPWKRALGSLSGIRFDVTLGPRGGLLKLSGMSSASAKAFQALLADKTTQAPAKDLEAWFSDETWKALLDAAFAEIPKPTAKKGVAPWTSKRTYPLPWTLDLGGRPLAPVSAAFTLKMAEGQAKMTGAFEEGQVDWQKKIPDVSPGYHSFGTSHKGSVTSIYGPRGLEEAALEWEVEEAWDSRGSWADHFSHTARASFSLKASP